MKKSILYIIVSLIIFSAQSQNSNYDHVNVFIGTNEQGHTFPGACVPFGMVQLSPDTDTVPYFKNGQYNKEVYRYCAGYQYKDKSIVGFSHTHFSGTGHSDLGDILIMPTVGKLKLNPGTSEDPDRGYRSLYNHSEESAEPGYYTVFLDDYSVKAELTCTERVGFHKYTFPESDSAHIILDLDHGIYNYEGKTLWASVRVENDTLITGYKITNGWARTRFIYFAITFSKPIEAYGSRDDNKSMYTGFWRKFNQTQNFPEPAGKALKMHFDFSTKKDEAIQIKVALSSVSAESALHNLQTEIPHNDFEKTRNDAKVKWASELDKIKIEANENTLVIFYSAMYHSLLHPNIWCDVNGKYRGIDNNIHESDRTNYTTFSLWDTYRALHPLLTITHPERVSDMVNSMLDHYDQSVHKLLPVWSHHGNENWCMIGYHAVPVIVDAYLKGIRDYDVYKAFEACIHSSTNTYYEGIQEYTKLGFVPENIVKNSASITLEYAYDDYCISKFAEALNKYEESKTYIKRSENYKNLFDKALKLTRPKNTDNTFKTPFDPLSTHGQGFIEGNSLNYSLYVPHDIQGYINLLGSKKALENHLDSLFDHDLDEKYYAHTEDVSKQGILGNYVHGNEPSHHVAYMYNWTDAPWKSQEKVYKILKTMYNNTNDGLCGNDDCGQMSAWYIFSALGFYPVCPGTNEYVFGTPIVKKAEISLHNGKTFKIIAKNLTEKNIYIDKVLLNGKLYNKTYIKHEDITEGGVLIFHMKSKPNKNRCLKKEDKGFSLKSN